MHSTRLVWLGPSTNAWSRVYAHSPDERVRIAGSALIALPLPGHRRVVEGRLGRFGSRTAAMGMACGWSSPATMGQLDRWSDSTRLNGHGGNHATRKHSKGIQIRSDRAVGSLYRPPRNRAATLLTQHPKLQGVARFRGSNAQGSQGPAVSCERSRSATVAFRQRFEGRGSQPRPEKLNS